MDKRTFGYIRVSTKEQNVNRQIDKMLKFGINERDLFIDKSTGTNFERVEYQLMIRMLRNGDLVVLDSLDRLGRNYDEVIHQWKKITREINADILVLDQDGLFDSRKYKQMGDVGKLLEDQFLTLMAYVADQERKKIRQRQSEGIAAAKARGVKLGRRPIQVDDEFMTIYKNWKKGELKGVEAIRLSNYAKSTFYKLVKTIES